MGLLKEMLDLLGRYARTVTRDDLEADREVWLKVKGALETAAQCAVDLALALVARRALAVLPSYRDAFRVLARAGVLDPNLARALEGWAGLRNVLVHIYTSLDLDRLHRALGETAALRSFHALVADELGRAEDPG